MPAGYATRSVPHVCEKRDYYADSVGRCSKNSFETGALMSSPKLLMTPLVPAKPLVLCHHDAVPVSLSETGNARRENEKTATRPGTAGNAADDVYDGRPHHHHNPSSNSNSNKKDIQDLEAAKAAVIFMDAPESLVQLVIDAEPLDPGMTFTSAQELYQRVTELLSDFPRQSQLFQKVHQHQQRQRQAVTTLSAGWADDLNEKKGSSSSGAEAVCQKLPTGMSEGSRQSATVTSSVFSSGLLSLEKMQNAAEGTTTPTVSEGACQQAASGCLSPEMGKSADATASPIAAPPEDALTSEGMASGHASSTLQQKEGHEESRPKKTSVQDLKGNQDKTSSNDDNPTQVPVEPQRAAVVTKTSPGKKPEEEQLRQKVRRLAKENWRLTQRKLCRSCKRVDLSSSGATFLPCGHFITCEACSEIVDNCPACGKVIMGTVRTFLS